MFTFTDEPNRMDFIDRTSGDRLILFYRTPSTEDRFGYENGKVKRKKGKVINLTGQMRRQYGLAIITGLGEGCFGKPRLDMNGKPCLDKNGKIVIDPVSSDPDSEHFDPDWKQYLKKYAAHLIEALAVRVFEEPVLAVPPMDDDETEPDDIEGHDDEDAEDDTKPDAEDATGN
ncbi:hypothetical protein [uncultured Pseudodesulfovibrio sp.]|uniref:hypothetical protein n=1 Tax=uncultured Pseudodesulfovibrio sp. TaxID=2035858 RepID=UPI0029C88824|nr:hypothetical protein [uncultured Pseudodesulfovibrio sp.]